MVAKEPGKEPRPSREERLAAKLRENLHRRKARARATTPAGDTARDNGKNDSPALPKSPPQS
ncbi:hypothetical protein [Novosphingobium album (ex Liu et al. 2023)]|uniref:Uncharacterized protein n=1 Tax=Novosphingobium album (ex Liu et al. 2023) TaxID=3031130 RepID=A0ABT5WNN9_9SPHN|nr:hypothetical protein [Novosphingobium album (ex Liu et al. 2023)]MDE8651647.1 hypothetical protein [Novosphingobium album (ex Liu et al. 2023)]